MSIWDTTAKKEEPQDLDKPLDDRIVDAIKSVYDPEIPVDIYELGLIYRIDRNQETNNVHVDMTLTSPNCPSAQELPIMVQNAVESVPEVDHADVDIVWDPPWGPEQMSEEARLELGFI